MTERQAAYREYLKSEHWARLRQQAFERDGCRCVECGTALELEGHHKVYRARWEDGVLEDIATLCYEHHRAKHPEKQAAPVAPAMKPQKPEPGRNNKSAWKLWWVGQNPGKHKGKRFSARRKAKTSKKQKKLRRKLNYLKATFTRPAGMSYSKYQTIRDGMSI